MLKEGDKFGRLTVVSLDHKDWFYHKHYLCMCDCGNQVIVNESNLRRGNTTSCGCVQRENRIKHGMYETRFYRIWKDMKVRCSCKSHHSYRNYGERNVSLCQEWNDFKNFERDMLEGYKLHFSEYGSDTTIDRIDVNSGYSKENCRWVTNLEQQQNRQDTIRTYDASTGSVISLRRYCIIHGLNYNTIRGRLRLGHSVQEAIAM